MMSKQKAELVYTTIHHDIRNDLNISIMEYCVADSIDKLSRKKRYDYTCKASKQWIADCIGTSKRTIITCINNLEDRGLVERVNGGQDVRPTDKWHDSVNARSEDTSHTREDTSHQKAENREDNSPPSNKNNTNKNTNNNIPDLEDVISYFVDNGYSKDAAHTFYDYYQTSVEDTQRQYWRDSRGNKIKNWKMKAQAVWFKDENKIENQQTSIYSAFS